MSPEVKARAIEPFYTTKEVGKGTGLGLSQVYGFARQSGGQLEIESAPGHGTTVRFYLPRASAEAVAAADTATGPTLSGRRAGSVLVVEDDPDVLEVAIESLQHFGYEVYSASNAPEALTILERDVPIDVLFTDIVMPKGISGIQLAHEARRLRPKLRVLVASGYTEEALQDHEHASESMDFIGKPYPLRELAEKLSAMIRQGTH